MRFRRRGESAPCFNCGETQFSIETFDGVRPVSVDQSPVRCAGTTSVSMRVGQTTCDNVVFYAVHGIEYGILSLPLSSQLGALIDCRAKTVTDGVQIPNVQSASVKTARVCSIRLAHSKTIQPGQETLLYGQIEGTELLRGS